jgi:hypothetical protein
MQPLALLPYKTASKPDYCQILKIYWIDLLTGNKSKEDFRRRSTKTSTI